MYKSTEKMIYIEVGTLEKKDDKLSPKFAKKNYVSN